MAANSASTSLVNLAAITAGIAGLLALLFIILFFTVGQPFGTLNDIFIGLTAILSAALAWFLFQQQAGGGFLRLAALVAALAGAVVVVAGSVLVISGKTGWFLAALYMAAGNALIGLWLLALSYAALRGSTWPHSLAVFGLVTGAILALGVFTLPGIIQRVDAMESASWVVNAGQIGALGYLVLYPIWCVLFSRVLR